MFKQLVLQRPLAVIDLETTGTNPQLDRIIELSVLKVDPAGEVDHLTYRLNPGMPIPSEASAVHGIFDEDVANQPGFSDVAPSLLEHLRDCDLCGFNLKRFDLRVLFSEFRRAGMALSIEGRAIIDALEIFHTYERRDLAAAVRLYLGRCHDDGHSAAADVVATAEVLDAMLDRYTDLPRDVRQLHQHFKDPGAVDSSRCFARVEGQIRFSFGKYRGQWLTAIARERPDYLRWMLEQDFFEDTKAVVRDALRQATKHAGRPQS